MSSDKKQTVRQAAAAQRRWVGWCCTGSVGCGTEAGTGGTAWQAYVLLITATLVRLWLTDC